MRCARANELHPLSAASRELMGTNAGWPEAFGFSVSGGAPVVIRAVEEGGSAQAAGLQPGDVIAELDGEDVQQWTLQQVLLRARSSAKVPPSLVVISRVRQFRLRRDVAGGYGITVRGSGPVFVRSVDVPSPAREAGLRSGDLLLEVNGRNVRQASKLEVLELLRASGDVLAVTVITGGLDWSIAAPPPLSSSSSTSLLSQSRLTRNKTRYQKAATFHNKVNYYLMGESEKKTHLMTLLRLYAGSRNVDSLAGSLDILLEGPIQRRLIPAIREFLQPRHRARFDALVSSSMTTPSRRKSVDETVRTRSLGDTRGAPWASSLPSLHAPVSGGHEKLVKVDRSGGGFGISLSGNAPVFIRAVDEGGPAQLAGLRAGDTLLAINGLNVRTATHSHVVRLLRGSGRSPSLLVSSTTPHRPSSSRHSLPRGGGASQRGGVATPLSVSPGVRESFRQKTEEVLEPQERRKLMKELEKFSQQKDIPKLVEGLQVLLNDPVKMQLFHHVCQLLPAETQTEFDRLAAASLGGEGVARDQWPNEDVLEDTAIGSVGEAGEMEGGLGPLLEQNEGNRDRENLDPPQQQQQRVMRHKRKSLENTPVGQALAAALSGSSTPLKSRGLAQATPPATPTNDITTSTTPGAVPPPPPTPVIGPGGIPIPPPPPPSLPSSYHQSHMKRVNWQKMVRTDGTVWGELSGLDEAIELAELESQFALRKSKESSERVRSKKPSVLDSKKAYNISILLKHLKLPASVIKEAVLSCDHSVLGEQHIRLMAAFAPDKRECLGLARYYDNPSVLSLPDQFSCEMSTIPCYVERLQAMLFRMHYQEKVDEMRPDLEAICQASVQLQKSKRFKKLLELVLAIGNHMNMGNVRIGQAQGFRVAFLSQLRGLRTTDGKSSLLHFLAGLTERKFPHVLEFHEDLSACSQAARVSGQTLEVEMNELSQGLRDIRRDIQEIDSRDELPGDRFHDIMTEFLEEAEEKTADLVELYSRMRQEFRQVVVFFGEDPVKTRIDDFFTIFASFSTDFQKAVRENRSARQRDLEEEKRLADRGTARRRGQANKPRPSEEDQYTQFKEELERTRLRPIPQRQTSGMEQRPQQTNFTRLLRPARNGTRNATPTKPSSPDDETFF